MADLKDNKPTMDDVSPADKKITSPNSKHVIITSGPAVKDSTVIDEVEEQKSDGPSLSHKVVINPINVNTPEPQVSPEDEKVEQPDEDNKLSQPDSKPTDVDQKPELPDQETSKSVKPGQTDNKNKSENTDQTDKLNETLKIEEKNKLKLKYDQLTESKKYYLPINTIAKKKTKKFLIFSLILIILLLVLWADIALDAGIIKIAGIKPFTHFFK